MNNLPIQVTDSRNLKTIQIEDTRWKGNSNETLIKVNKILNDVNEFKNPGNEELRFDWHRFKTSTQEMQNSLIVKEGEDGIIAEYRNPSKKLTPGAMDSTMLHYKKAFKQGVHVIEINIEYVSPIQYNSHVHLYIGIGQSQGKEEPSKICRWWLSLTKMMFLLHFIKDIRMPMISQYPPNVMDLPKKMFMILDMDIGTVGFIANDKYLGHAFGGLRGCEIIPNISYYGNVDCDIKMECIGSYCEPRSLLEICGKRISQLVSKEALSNGLFDELNLPESLNVLVIRNMNNSLL